MPIEYDITKDNFYQEGRQEGLEVMTITMIKNMIKRNTDLKFIAEVAEVSLAYVKKIKKEMEE